MSNCGWFGVSKSRWCTNHKTELEMRLYAASSTSAGISSIRTGTSPGLPWAGSAWRAASLSASLSAAHSQSAPPSAATAPSPEVSPDTMPPPPRLANSDPSAARLYETGPRFEATMSSRLGSLVIWNKRR